MARSRAVKNSVTPRKIPRQKRAEETVTAIVEAAARILESKGFEGFNTNAVAERAGVSIGSLYQYFPSKNALLRALIEREAAPLIAVGTVASRAPSCRAALRCFIQVSIYHQMRRPGLARLIDIAENWDTFDEQVSGKMSCLQAAVADILRRRDAPRVSNVALAAEDVLAITRSLVDGAGGRGEGESTELVRRVEGAIWGYLRGSSRVGKKAAAGER